MQQSSAEASLTATLTTRLTPLRRACASGAGANTLHGAFPDRELPGRRAPRPAPWRSLGLPGDHGVAFPATSGEVFSLPAAALDALGEFCGTALCEPPRTGAPLRERIEAFAHAIGVLQPPRQQGLQRCAPGGMRRSAARAPRGRAVGVPVAHSRDTPVTLAHTRDGDTASRPASALKNPLALFHHRFRSVSVTRRGSSTPNAPGCVLPWGLPCSQGMATGQAKHQEQLVVV